MPIDSNEVLRIAALARLGLEPGEVERLRVELEGILDHMAAVGRLNLDGVPPAAHPLEAAALLRDDLVEPSLSQDEALRAAPDAARGHFRVPKVLGA